MNEPPDRGRQLDLFGASLGAPRGGKVGPAAVSPEHEALARALPANVRLGTSSWSFPGWCDLVYDRRASPGQLAREGLAAYARHPLLRTVGIDRTFYAPLAAADFAAYAASVPECFRFLVKALGECTTPYKRGPSGRPAGGNPRYLDASYATDVVVAPFVEGLGAKAGPLVFQFPPQGSRTAGEPGRFAERLGRFLEALPMGPRYAVELRDPELLCAPYHASLAAAAASHCVSVHSRMPPPDRQRSASGNGDAGPLVVRWMLGAGLGYEQARDRYDPFDRIVDEDAPTRSSLTERCVESLVEGRDVFVIANNKAEGSAPLTVFKLARSIVSRLEDDSATP